jgi:uncharacterized membrane protein YeaQ/YmgE (transglycosylase-associated protein family)
MGIISWIIIGGLAGWVASIILKTNEEQGLIGNVIAGVLGGIVGGWIFSALGGDGVSGFSFWSFLVALVGAIVVLLIKGAITGKRAI